MNVHASDTAGANDGKLLRMIVVLLAILVAAAVIGLFFYIGPTVFGWGQGVAKEAKATNTANKAEQQRVREIDAAEKAIREQLNPGWSLVRNESLEYEDMHEEGYEIITDVKNGDGRVIHYFFTIERRPGGKYEITNFGPR